jgi:hypothetical protein
MIDRAGLVQHYVRAYGVFAVCLFARRGRREFTPPIFVRVGRDPAAALEATQVEQRQILEPDATARAARARGGA